LRHYLEDIVFADTVAKPARHSWESLLRQTGG
jgi:hypothetical protein